MGGATRQEAALEYWLKGQCAVTISAQRAVV